jgi:NSS family neurotransmitter:Na+ symporter
VTVVCLIGALGSVVFTTRAGLYILDIVDHFVNNYGLLTGGIAECLFVGWVLKAAVARDHVNRVGTVRLPGFWDFLIKYGTPVLLLLVVGFALVNECSSCYGGYPASALLLVGVGWLFGALVLAVILSRKPGFKADS